MEYVVGQLVGRNVADYFHSRLQTLLLIRTGSARYPIPDICVMSLRAQSVADTR